MNYWHERLVMLTATVLRFELPDGTYANGALHWINERNDALYHWGKVIR